mgnify:FL=1
MLQDRSTGQLCQMDTDVPATPHNRRFNALMSKQRTFYRSERLGALTDGLFAIVLTLLVLELKIPEDPAPGTDVIDVLINDWEAFAGWLISFVILARLWMFQHHAAASARFVSSRSIAINFAFLATVSLIPFSAHLVSAFELARPIVLQIFSLIIGLVSIFLGWFMKSVQRDQRALGRSEPNSQGWTQGTIHHLVWVPIVAVVAAITAQLDPRLALAVWTIETVIVLVIFLTARSDGDLHIYAPDDN